ncbi:hypothetical protein Tco_0184323 [Tanacetum coccineum]
MMDIFTKGALCDYWKIGGDEIEIETDIFDYETLLCLTFNECNYLLKVDPDLLKKDIMGFKTYEDYKDDWIYEWNKKYNGVYGPCWLDNGIWKPTVSYFDDLDFFKDFENEFPAIVYNDALTSKSDFLIEPTLSPQHVYKFDLNDEAPLSECDEAEQNVLYFIDLFSFNVVYPNGLKSDKDNDDDKIAIEHS